MKRNVAISMMRVAGYHDDQRERVRLIVESHVNRQTMDSAWVDGQNAKKNGVRCDCFECRYFVSR